MNRIFAFMIEKEETIGDRIRRLREEQGWTQEALAERASTLQENVARYETGAVKGPDPRILWRIARALGVTTCYLVSGIKDVRENLFKYLHRYEDLPVTSQEVIKAMAAMIDQKIMSDLPIDARQINPPEIEQNPMPPPGKSKKDDVA